jgi:hypothetical protein
MCEIDGTKRGDFAAVTQPTHGAFLLRLIETDDYTIAMEQAVLCFWSGLTQEERERRLRFFSRTKQ